MNRGGVTPIAQAGSSRVLRGLVRACGADIELERGLLAGSVVTVLLTVLFRVLEPWPLKLIYDFIFRHGHGKGKELALLGGALAPLENGHRLTLIWIAVCALVAFNALAGAFDYLSSVAMGIAASRVLSKLRARLFQHLQALGMRFHRKHKNGDLTAAVTADIDRLRDVTVSAFLPFVSNGLALLAMVGVMLWMNWRLGLLVLVAFPAFYLVVTRITARIERVAREQRQRDGGIAAIASEAIGAVQTIQAFGLEAEFAQRFSGDNQGSLTEGNRAQRLSARLERTIDLFASVTMAGVLLLGASSVLDGKLTAGDLIVFVSYLRNSFKPIRQTAKYLAQIAKALASGGRVLALLGEKPEVEESPLAIEARGLRGAICFEGVSFAYRAGHPVLKEISFEVRPGERVAIVGPSGSGKSTLAALLLRFYDPQMGTIRVDGEDIRDYTLKSLREQISVVMQDSVLFTGTIRDNIRFGSLAAGGDAIQNAAVKARADEFIARMGKAYETQVGERGATLSGGQRQRIAIARAYLRDASILLLDEATTGLDTHNKSLVLSALRELSATRTTLTITHEISEAKNADRILFLCDGRLEEQGTHEQLMRRDGGYKALYLQHNHAGMREAAAHAV
jgi:ATP-binding cassette subfamily B protein